MYSSDSSLTFTGQPQPQGISKCSHNMLKLFWDHLGMYNSYISIAASYYRVIACV